MLPTKRTWDLNTIPSIDGSEGPSPKMKRCLNNGVMDGDYLNSDGETLLGIVCAKGHMEKVKYLLDQGADVNKPNCKGMTPLYKACSRGDIEIAKLLIDHGADVGKKNDVGETAFQACFMRRVFSRRNIVIAKLLLDNGVVIDEPGVGGATLLWLATFCGHTEAVKFLLENGADVNREHIGTPILSWYSSNGANVQASDRRGLLPIHNACQKGHTEIVRELLIGGASVNEATTSGVLPFTMACERNSEDVAQLLFNHGISNGETPNYM